MICPSCSNTGRDPHGEPCAACVKDGKVTIAVSGAAADRCTEAGCGGRAATRCRFELSGRATGRICGRAICARDAEKTGGTCGPHARLEAARRVRA